jgi:hypothetical protein
MDPSSGAAQQLMAFGGSYVIPKTKRQHLKQAFQIGCFFCQFQCGLEIGCERLLSGSPWAFLFSSG